MTETGTLDEVAGHGSAAIVRFSVVGLALVAALCAGLGAPATASAQSTYRRVQDDHPWLRWGGSWTWVTGDIYSGRTARAGRSSKSWVSMEFKGSGVALVAHKGPDRGRVKVSIDGKKVATVSLYATSTVEPAVVWSSGKMRNKTHTVKFERTGTKDSVSSDSRVTIDAIEVLGKIVSPGSHPGVRVQNGDPRIYAKGKWKKVQRKAALGDSTLRTSRKGDSVTVRFKGTQVIWWGRKEASAGLVDVVLDGEKVATVDAWAAKTSGVKAMWAAHGLKNKTHTLIIRNAGPSSARSGSGSRMEFDAFQVKGTVDTVARPTPFKYPWKTYIVIDKSEFRLYWVKNKKLVKVYPVAHGKQGWSTPERVWRIDAKYKTSPGSVYGPRKMRMFKRVGKRFVFSNYAIHGTNQEWVIGTRASHGCIRMYNKDVRELFPKVPLGTMVVTRN